MQPMRASLDDDICGLVRGVAADLRTSIALNRVLVRTLATLSPDCAVAASTALEDEIEQNQRSQGSSRTLETLSGLQSALVTAQEEESLARKLEQALTAAAAKLSAA